MSLLTLLTLAITTPALSLTLPSSVPLIPLNNNTLPSNRTLNPDGTLTGITPILGSSYFCNKMRFGQKIKIRNCNDASTKLYGGHDIGNFHIGEPSNQFKLPQGAETGDCNLDISLNGEEREPGTWVGIKLALHELIVACADGSTTSTGTGYITTGPRSRIRIEIRRLAVSANNDEEGDNGGDGLTGGEANHDSNDQGGITPVGGYPLYPSTIAVA